MLSNLLETCLLDIYNMPSPQKQKGSSFEREVATFLTKTYNESFIRAPGSGAYVGGKNQSRKEVLHEGQIRSFKGDIVPGQSFPHFNAECKSYKDFPFHLVVSGDCKVLNTWLDQLMTVAEPNDCSILFMKFNRKGRFVAVQAECEWILDNYIHYKTTKYKDWLITEFDSFFQHNTELLKRYSAQIDTKSIVSQTINKNIH